MGCAYFRSHASAFEFTSPVALYNSVNVIGSDTYDTHKKWLTLIRKAVWLRADMETQNMPSVEALKLHWCRCLWILGLWHSSTENDIDLPGTLDK